jgi:hypothetical protein
MPPTVDVQRLALMRQVMLTMATVGAQLAHNDALAREFLTAIDTDDGRKVTDVLNRMGVSGATYVRATGGVPPAGRKGGSVSVGVQAGPLKADVKVEWNC